MVCVRAQANLWQRLDTLDPTGAKERGQILKAQTDALRKRQDERFEAMLHNSDDDKDNDKNEDKQGDKKDKK